MDFFHSWLDFLRSLCIVAILCCELDENHGLTPDLKGRSSLSVVYTWVHECEVYPSEKINIPAQELANIVVFTHKVNIFLSEELRIFLSGYNK